MGNETSALEFIKTNFDTFLDSDWPHAFLTFVDDKGEIAEMSFSAFKKLTRNSQSYISSTATNLNPIVFHERKSPELCAALIACLLLEKTFFVINPVFSRDYISRLAEMFPQLFLLNAKENIGKAFCHQSNSVAHSFLSKEVAYFAHTSGSSKEPKIVSISWKNLDSYLGSFARAFPSFRSKKQVQVFAPGFDMFVGDLFYSILKKNSLWILDGYNFSILPKIFHSYTPGIWFSTPSMGEAMLQVISPYFNSISCLEQSYFIGENLSGGFLEKWRHLFPGSQIVNMYGPTETTMGICSFSLTEKTRSAQAGTNLIGKPFEGNKITLVIKDSDGIGEMVISGEQVGMGYLNPKTAEVLAFGQSYATGDLAKLRDDGELEFCGRKDHQFKWKGIRYDAREIERVLVECGGTSPCYIFSLNQNMCLVIFSRQIVENLSEVFNRMAKVLSHPIAPDSIYHFHEIPLSPTGKLNGKLIEQIISSGSKIGYDEI